VQEEMYNFGTPAYVSAECV